jgi:hypothetical protein
MGNELAAACIFCAGLLLGSGVSPLHGFTGEITGVYGTLRRQTDGSSGTSRSDTTGKFPLVGVGWTRPAADGLGAGTPAWEASARLGWAASHSEGGDPAEAPAQVLLSGAGRFENVALAFRVAPLPSGSVETFFVQHRFTGTDVYDVGGFFQYAGQRLLIAMRRDLALGWRQRFPNAEIAGRFQYTALQGKTNDAAGNLQGNGSIWGGGADMAFVHGAWRFGAGGEWLSGSVGRFEQFAPDFSPVSGSDPASLRAAGLRIERSFRRVTVHLVGFWEEAALGWVSYAMLAEELRRFDDGFRPASDARSVGADFTVRVRAGAGVVVKALGRFVRSSETVTFTDAFGIRPSATLDVRSPPTHQFAFGLGLEFTLGAPGATPTP